ncbi:MAG: LacI family DNA-binding transcriptional regulator [Clostridium sp.]|nr:LacI family DNA-binding transcriptional regulator [Clostridium sp.]
MSKVTLADVANEVNVSKTTVSMVLNNKGINVSDETRKKIFEAAKKLNYVPNSLARSLSTKKTYTIGFIIPNIENPFFSEMAKAMETEAEKYSYSMILCNTFNNKEKEEDYVKLLISKLIDGVAIVPTGEKSKSIEILKSNDIPFVILDRQVDESDEINGVFCDNREGVKLGVKYLLNKGFKKIAFVDGNKYGIKNNSRLEYFCEIAKELDIFDEELVLKNEISLEGGINATMELINKNKEIDAIFYGSDVMAIGGMKCLIRRGYSIPKDISILGYDNIDICSFVEPELTTIAQPIYKMGQEACRLLIDEINNKNSVKKVMDFKSYLVERRTVK